MKSKAFDGLSWWSAVSGVNFLFQIYRGSLQDIIIFTIAWILIILESSHYLDWIPEFKKLRKLSLNKYLLIAFSLYLLFTKRETPLTIWIFAALFIYLFLDLWRRDNGEKSKLSPTEIKSARAWGGIGIILCFWELLAFVLASISKDDYSYPTISVLIAPHLDGLIGRGIFIIAWAAVGFLIINDWREPE